MSQLRLMQAGQPDLTDYDVILVNTSGGKDSQTCLRVTYEAAVAAGVVDRLIVVHADLGRVEWEGTKELARTQANHYGLPLHVVRNRAHRDLLARIEMRGRWPGAETRYCTSEFKTAAVRSLASQLGREQNIAAGRTPNSRSGPPLRVLNVLGIRAQESAKRAKRESFRRLPKPWTVGVRTADEWLPIFDWSEDEVWADIRRSGVPHHPAYDKGMGRLSCVFCVFAPRHALSIAIRENPKLADEYVALEQRIDHRFTDAYSFASVVEATRAGQVIEAAGTWAD